MEICFTSARQLARLIRARKLSATEVVNAFIAQIERVNPKVNAIVTFTPELALKRAKSIDRGKPLAGLPIAYKDLVPTKDVRTTFGSLIYRDHVPTEAHAGASPRVAFAECLGLARGDRPDGAHRGRLRLSSLCHGRPRPARAGLDRRAGRNLLEEPEERLRESPRRVEPRPRRPADGRSRHRRPVRAEESVQGSWLRAGRSGTRFLRRHRSLRNPARARLPAALRRPPQAAPRQTQGHRDLEHRGGPQAHARENRPRSSAAQRPVPPHAAVPGALRVPPVPGQPAAALPDRRGMAARGRRRAHEQLP